MSIETNLGSIANSLERIADILEHLARQVDTPPDEAEQ